jgi:hypothetical protein
MSQPIVSKSIVTVSEMCRMLNLSRSRFYQLVREGVFPTADHDPISDRPFYNEEKQLACLAVRRTNRGVNQKPVLFYATRCDDGIRKKNKRQKSVPTIYRDLVDLLAGANVTASVAVVQEIVGREFPNGIQGIDLGTVVKAVLSRINARNPSDNVGR